MGPLHCLQSENLGKKEKQGRGTADHKLTLVDWFHFFLQQRKWERGASFLEVFALESVMYLPQRTTDGKIQFVIPSINNIDNTLREMRLIYRFFQMGSLYDAWSLKNAFMGPILFGYL